MPKQQLKNKELTVAILVVLVIVAIGAGWPAGRLLAVTDSNASSTPEQEREGDQAALDEARQTDEEGGGDADLETCISEFESQASNYLDSVNVGMQFVPVHEVGQLLALSEETNTNVGMSRDILIKICMHLKAIKRVQYAFEQREFVDNPYARRSAAVDTDQYTSEIFNMVQTGYQSVDSVANSAGEGGSNGGGASGSWTEGDTPMFPTNQLEHLENVRKEATAVFKEDVKIYSGSAFANEVIQALEENKIENPLTSSLERSKIDSFNNDGGLSIISSDEWWDIFTKINEPENTRVGAYLTAKGILDQVENEAEQNARDELIQAQGFLPNRECTEKTQDEAWCRKWTTISPGIVISRSTSDAIRARLDELLNVDKASDVVPGTEPQLSQTTTVSPADSNVNSTPSGYDPVNYPEDNEDNNGNGILDGFEDDNGNGVPDYRDDDSTGNKTPSVTLTQTSPTLTEITADPTKNVSILSWTADNTDSCQAGNPWIRRGSLAGTVEVFAVKKAEVAPKQGSSLIYLPLSFGLTYLKNNTVQNISSAVDANQIGQTTTVNFTGITMNDKLALKFNLPSSPTLPTGGNYSVEVWGATSGSSALQAFKNKIDALRAGTTDAGRDLAKYQFSYQTVNGADGELTIGTVAIYQIKCVGNNTTVTDTVTITR